MVHRLYPSFEIGIPKAGVADGTVVRFPEGTAPNGLWAEGDGILCYLEGTSLHAVDSSRKRVWTRTALPGTDRIRFSDHTILAYSRSSQKVERISPQGRLLSTVSLTGMYQSVLESDKGLVFMEPDTGMYAWVRLKGEGRGSFPVSDGKILLSRVNPITGDLAIATLRNNQGSLETTLLRYDSEGRLSGVRAFQGAVLVDAGFEGDTLVVILDSGILALNDQMRELWTLREPSRFYQTSFGPDFCWMHRFPDGQSTAALQYMDSLGHIGATVPLDAETSLLAAYPDKRVAAASDRQIWIYDGKGKKIDGFQLDETPTGISWLDNGHIVLQYKNRVDIRAVKSGGFL